jgi:hypothetical protein
MNEVTSAVTETAKNEGIEAVNSNEMKPKSASQLKYESTVQKYIELQKTRILTTNELKIFTNAEERLESRSASRVFKDVIQLNKASMLLGEAIPKKKEGKEELRTKFLAQMPQNKQWFSLWDGLGALVKLNKQAKNAQDLAKKLEKQGGQIGAQADVQTANVAQIAEATEAVANVVNEVLESVPA